MIESDVCIKKVHMLNPKYREEADKQGLNENDLVIIRIKYELEKIEGSPSAYLQNKIKELSKCWQCDGKGTILNLSFESCKINPMKKDIDCKDCPEEDKVPCDWGEIMTCPICNGDKELPIKKEDLFKGLSLNRSK